jgi:hypothetical protein
VLVHLVELGVVVVVVEGGVLAGGLVQGIAPHGHREGQRMLVLVVGGVGLGVRGGGIHLPQPSQHILLAVGTRLGRRNGVGVAWNQKASIFSSETPFRKVEQAKCEIASGKWKHRKREKTNLNNYFISSPLPTRCF